jgi:hypothetical protein
MAFCRCALKRVIEKALCDVLTAVRTHDRDIVNEIAIVGLAVIEHLV